jgi:tRNA(Ile)-lysidine synthase
VNDLTLTGLDDLDPGTRVVVGCSGGADSLALLTLACAHGFSVVAVYVDHGLRSNTAHDAAGVAEAAARFGAEFRLAHVDFDGRANLEARARDARYAALERVRAEVGAHAILVGHTRDDQAETVLLNFLRGSGTAGLAGMPARRGSIRRPLLGVRRAATREMCRALGLVPVHDPMNDELRHRRVWLRREIVPALERGAQRDLVEVLARQADLLRDDDELLAGLAAESDPTDAAALARMPAAIARRAVRRRLRPPPPSSATVERILEVARGERRAVELPGGERVERVGGRLVYVRRSEDSSEESSTRAGELAVPGRARFSGLDFEAWIELGPPTGWPDGRATAVFDADAVGVDPLTIRGPRKGERYRPLGRQGSKLVHDALAEAGVAASRRSTAPVVAAATEPVWVVGYRIDHRVRVTSRTRRFLWLTAEPASP